MEELSFWLERLCCNSQFVHSKDHDERLSSSGCTEPGKTNDDDDGGDDDDAYDHDASKERNMTRVIVCM